MIIQSGKKKSGGDGFTLIELAIVLVIVGLLITGVIQGRELIKQASIVAQVEQISDLKRGTLAFKLKYRCLPGDCRSATTFWPSESLTNGNQNGWIETTGGLTYDTPGITWAASNEINNFFKQLSLSKLIKGGPYDTSYVVGTGLPPMVLSPKTSMFAGSRRNYYTFGTGRDRNLDPVARGNNAFFMIVCSPQLADAGGGGMNFLDDVCGIFSPEEAYSLDAKIDDGKPNSGLFYGFSNYGNAVDSCVNVGATEYEVTKDLRSCSAAYTFD